MITIWVICTGTRGGGTAWEVRAGDDLAGQMPGYSAVNLRLGRRLAGPQ